MLTLKDVLYKVDGGTLLVRVDTRKPTYWMLVGEEPRVSVVFKLDDPRVSYSYKDIDEHDDIRFEIETKKHGKLIAK